MLIRLAAAPAAMESEITLAPGFEPVLAAWGARRGEILTVADPAGCFYRARLLADDGRVRVFERLPPGVEPLFARRLCPAITDRERMIWTIQKGVELGATEIQPLQTRHGQPGDGSGPRQDKSATWNRVARKAARQCRRGRIPAVLPPIDLQGLLTRIPPGEILFFFDVSGERVSLDRWTGKLNAPVTLLIGPEGGWSDGERDHMRGAGAVAVSLGARLLRAETAALAALAVLMTADIPFTRKPG